MHDNNDTFLLSSEEGNIYKFESYKRFKLKEDIGRDVKLINRFNECYLLVRKLGTRMTVELFKSLDPGIQLHEFDLSFPKSEAVCPPNEAIRKDEKISVLMIPDIIFTDGAVELFNQILLCDLPNLGVRDVLLLAIDEKLLWIKYKFSYCTKNEDIADNADYTIETVYTSKAKIIALKFIGCRLILLDELSILTILEKSPSTNEIKKRELLLDGKLECFDFNTDLNLFVYSNIEKVTLMHFKNQAEQEVVDENVLGIISLSIVPELNCVIAISRNRLFFYIPIRKKRFIYKKNSFQMLEDDQLCQLPDVAKYLAEQERVMLEMEQQIRNEISLGSKLRLLEARGDMPAGKATIHFLNELPQNIPNDAIMCKNFDRAIRYIELQINMLDMPIIYNSSIAFSRILNGATVTRTIKIKDQLNHCIYVPRETEDGPTKKMSLDLNSSLEFNGQKIILTYPIIIESITPSSENEEMAKKLGPPSLDECLKMIGNLKPK